MPLTFKRHAGRMIFGGLISQNAQDNIFEALGIDGGMMMLFYFAISYAIGSALSDWISIVSKDTP